MVVSAFNIAYGYEHHTVLHQPAVHDNRRMMGGWVLRRNAIGQSRATKQMLEVVVFVTLFLDRRYLTVPVFDTAHYIQYFSPVDLPRIAFLETWIL